MNIKISRLLVLLSTLLLVGGTLYAQQFSKAEETKTIVLSAEHHTVTRDIVRNILRIDLDVTPYTYVCAQQLLRITPVYVFTDRSKEIRFNKIYVAGSSRYKILKRQHDLYDNDALGEEVYSRPKGPAYAQGIRDLPHMVYECPSEFWMEQGHVELGIEVFSCGNCSKGICLAQGGPQSVLIFGPKDYRYDYIVPAATVFKEYTESFDAKIQFVVNKHDLLRDYKGNAQELARLGDFVHRATKIEGAELQAIGIRGYASPEGGFEHNKIPSERRIKTLDDRAKRTYPNLINRIEVVAEGMGEDQDDLRKLVDASDMFEHQTILDIIDKYNTDTECEADIKALDEGKVHRNLLESDYPKFRRTTFTMSYRVRPFEVSGLAHIYSTNLKLLSFKELHTLAQQIIARGESSVAIYRAGYEQNASDPVARLSYANALLEYDKNANEAYKILSTIQSDSRAKSPTAIALDMIGRKAEAETLYFKK